MEAERRLLRPRKPLSDRTNTDSHSRPSSQSSSSTASVLKPPKPYPSSSFTNSLATKSNYGTRTRSSAISTNHHHPSNPTLLPPPRLSTPSRPPNSSNLPGTIDRDDSLASSVALRRRHTSDKKSSDDASIPSFLQPSIFSTPSQPRKPSFVSVSGSSDHHVYQPASIVYSRRHTSEKRKGKEKVVVDSFSVPPMPKTFKIWEKNNEVEGVSPPKARALTVPCRKKRRTKSTKQDEFQHALPQDFIEKQQAYFKEIDNFELLEEEVESIDDLD